MEQTQPNTAENPLVDKLEKLEKAGMGVTKEWVDMWQTSLRYFFSDQLKGKKRHADWDWVVINYIWPSAMQEIAKLSKNHPRIIANGWSTDDADGAEVWQNGTQWQWENGLQMRLQHIAAILDGKLFGYRVSKVYWEDKVRWDNREQRWVGDVKYKLWHPAMFWVSPEAERVQDANACGTIRLIEVEEAVKKWPKKAAAIREQGRTMKEWMANGVHGGEAIASSKQTGTTSGSGGADNWEPGSSTQLMEIVSTRVTGNGKKELDKNKKYVKVSETYFKDYSEEKATQEEPYTARELIEAGAASQSPTGEIVGLDGTALNRDTWPMKMVRDYKRPKFPFGRHVLRVGDVIINDKEEDQVWPYENWPFVVTPHYLLPHTWQGINAVTMYKDTQDMINVSVSYLLNHMKMHGDPKHVFETDAIAKDPNTKKAYKIFAGAGSLIKLARGGLKKFQQLDPPNMSPSIPLLYNILTQEFKNLTGLHGIAMGEPLKSDTTATEASVVAMSSTDRVALQSVYEDEWVRQVAMRIAEIMQYHYDEGRWVRIVGEDKIDSVVQITQGAKEARFDIKVELGAMLPFDEKEKIAKYQSAYTLLENPTYNPMLPDMLRVYEIPNWQKLLEQYEPYVQYKQFVQLYQQVKEGQIDPQQAVQMLVQKATEIYQSEGITSEPETKGPRANQ